jgi:hypothetical protein
MSGVHDNMIWIRKEQISIYTMNNKLIIENTKSRQQSVLCDTSSRLSCLSIFDDDKFLVVGEGEPSENGYACIYYYQLGESPRLMQKLSYHKSGVQSLDTFQKNKPPGQQYRFVISASTAEEHTLVMWDLTSGCTMRSFADIGGIAN